MGFTGHLTHLRKSRGRRTSVMRLSTIAGDTTPEGKLIVQPDVVFVRKERMHTLKDGVRGVPDLAIEVISPSHPERDRFIKT